MICCVKCDLIDVGDFVREYVSGFDGDGWEDITARDLL